MSSDDEHILDEDASEDPKEVEGNIVDLEVDDLKVGLNFSTEEIALQSIENWLFKSLCALAKIRYRKGKNLLLHWLHEYTTPSCLDPLWFLRFLCDVG